MDFSAVRQELFNLKDEVYRERHLKTCPGACGLLGVRVPEVRRIAKQVSKGDFRKFLAAKPKEYYEEVLIEGIVIAAAKMPFAERLQYLQKFVPKIDNWAICDGVCASFRLSKTELPLMWDFILQYQNSIAEFELRFMIVMMLDHFVTETYLAQVLKINDNITSNAYYVNMATAWLVAEAFIKYRDQTLEFLRHNHLSRFTFNKAIQKCIESFRVSDEDKLMLRQMKRP